MSNPRDELGAFRLAFAAAALNELARDLTMSKPLDWRNLGKLYEELSDIAHHLQRLATEESEERE